ncbi:hypothetical protein DEO72_LG7g1618 [Vigna unguiculata]|uniref:Uncharacterized protein n=1 Tax=Vigna unguiculata TaxID=3917 RepID=A0A4D6MH39_VIGUN|nr:hypothetical protein DEO72_LG7g1618 [Vigna unguiculata]
MRRREDGAAGTAMEMEVVVVAAPWCAERQWWLKEVLRWRSGAMVVGKQTSMVADGDGGGGCRGGWSWWLKLGLGFHE